MSASKIFSEALRQLVTRRLARWTPPGGVCAMAHRVEAELRESAFPRGPLVVTHGPQVDLGGL